ncbi:MAG: TIR domain-containing protein [Candidatus Binatia bacterium]
MAKELGEFTYDVFLSHSAKDRDVVRAVAERLRADGLRVWFDEWEIRPDDSLSLRERARVRAAKIEDGLEHSRVLVLCMSAHAFGSEWAQLEAGTFRFRDPLNKERRFIPLRLDDAPIKGALAQFLYINWLPEAREQAYAKLLEACAPPAKLSAAETEATGEQLAEKVIKLDYTAGNRAYAYSLDGKRVLSGADDSTVRLWDLETGRCLRVLEGHTATVWSVVWNADQRRAVSGADDKAVRLWDLETGRCLRVLVGHTLGINCLALGTDQRRVLSGADDSTVRLWDLETGQSLRVLEGHTGIVWSVAWNADQRRSLSGAQDKTVRLWDVETGQCLRVLKGHTDAVRSVALSADQRRALSGAKDKTVRLWDLETGQCLRVLEGHTGGVRSVAWSADQRLALSGAEDGSVLLWHVETGQCLRRLQSKQAWVMTVAWSANQQRAFSGDVSHRIYVWNLSEFATGARALATPAVASPRAPDQVQYTNAKVLLVGESGAGKTGLTARLAHDRPPQRDPSTSGAWSTQWPLKDLPEKPGWEREVWLWDFGGQADQRLIHQLYLDHTALVLLLFNADQESVLPGLREWQQALARSVAHDARTFLVAGRTDVGFRFDREKVRTFARENGYEYFETSAETAHGIPELRKAMLEKIPWDQLTPHNSPALFKQLKDEILKLRDEGLVLATFKELEGVLRNRLPAEVKFADAQLETVVSL